LSEVVTLLMRDPKIIWWDSLNDLQNKVLTYLSII
jgi:hypothetical protein